MITQKLYKNGNSIAVTIPKNYLDQLNLDENSEVIVEKQASKLIISKHRKKMPKGINLKFMRMVDEFIDRHQDVLAELAKK